MIESIKNDLRYHYRHGGMISKLLIINIGVFILIMIMRVVLFIIGGGQVPAFFHTITNGLSLGNTWKLILFRPWTLVTHMFLHLTFFHILINMLYLFWFGRVLENLLGARKILNIYIASGLMGALLFFIFSGLLYEGRVF